MRNKILVLVLALVCLLGVSAMAANVKDSFTPEQQDAITAALAEIRKVHTPYAAQNPANYTTYGQKDLIVADYVATTTCDADADDPYIVFICTCDECKEAGWDYATKSGELFAKKLAKVDLEKPNHQRKSGTLGDHVDATCKAAGWGYYECAVCGDEYKYHGDETNKNQFFYDKFAKKEHTEVTKTEPATCTELGYTLVYCSVCKTEISKTVNTAAGLAKHVYTLEDGVTLNKVTEVVTYNTCAQAGQTKTTVYCVNCNQVNPDAAVVFATTAKIDHDLTAINAKFEVTDKTNANGLKYAELNCDIDAAFKADEAKEAGTYHVLEDGTRLFKKGTLTFKYEPMTCDKDGLITISCNVCDKHDVQYAVKSLDHQPEHTWDQPEMEDCTKSYTVGFTCRICKGVFTEVIGSQPYHEYNEDPNYIIQYWNNGATKVEIYRHWENWDHAEWDEEKEEWTGIVEYNNVAFINGKLVEDVVPAACLPYTEVYQCVHHIWGDWGCQATKAVEVKATAKNHSKVPTTAEGKVSEKDVLTCEQPTCTSTGSATYACAYCGDTVSATVPQLKHIAKNAKWTVATQPTCEAPGKATNVCKLCSLPMEEELPQLKHELVYNEKLSTPANSCTAGLKVYKCENCGETKSETVDAPHNEANIKNGMYDYTAYEEATCYKAGYKTFVCADCDKSVTVTIPKVAHKFPVLTEEMFNQVGFVKDATCCTPAYYKLECVNCPANNKAVKVVFMGEAEGHKDLTAQELAEIRDAVYSNDFSKYTKDKLAVNGVIDCYNAATGTLYCKEQYDVWTENEDGTWSKSKTKGVCDHVWTFDLPAREHDWSEALLDEETGKYYVECMWEDCDAVKDATEIKPEYTISLDGTKGKVVLKDKNMSALKQAWVRISYGFELSDGSYLAMTTCMPVTFEWIDDVQVGTFSFFALNTSLESTGVNIMVVDQYDDMYKTIGELVGDNYGLYIG